MFYALVETCNTQRLARFTFPLVGGGMGDCAGSSKERLPPRIIAICVLEGSFTGAFWVTFFSFFIALIFSACSSSSLELFVKLQLELEYVTSFYFLVFADFLSLELLLVSPVPFLFPPPASAFPCP